MIGVGEASLGIPVLISGKLTVPVWALVGDLGVAIADTCGCVVLVCTAVRFPACGGKL